MKIHAITISGEIASGKSSIADSLIALLPGWRRINTGQLFRDFTESKGLSIQQVSFLRDEIHKAFDTEQRKMLEVETKILVEGRLAGCLASGLEGIFKVYCYAPLEVRIERYMKREKVSWQNALNDIAYRDSRDLEKFRKIYGISDYRSLTYYDIQVDTSGNSPDNLAQLIINKAGLSMPDFVE